MRLTWSGLGRHGSGDEELLQGHKTPQRRHVAPHHGHVAPSSKLRPLALQLRLFGAAPVGGTHLRHLLENGPSQVGELASLLVLLLLVLVLVLLEVPTPSATAAPPESQQLCDSLCRSRRRDALQDLQRQACTLCNHLVLGHDTTLSGTLHEIGHHLEGTPCRRQSACISPGLAAHLCMDAGGWLCCPAPWVNCLPRSCGVSCSGPEPAAAAWCVLAGGRPLCELACCCLYPVALHAFKAMSISPQGCVRLTTELFSWASHSRERTRHCGHQKHPPLPASAAALA